MKNKIPPQGNKKFGNFKHHTMKKITLLMMLLLGLGYAGRAQYVAIPDTNFGTWLNTHGYATCMTGSNAAGWQLDTTCTSVTTAGSVSCGFAGIHDLTGIEYFKSLTILDCSFSYLTTMPILPASLSTFYCASNLLTSIGTLPASLTYLQCSNNLLASLPALPSTLTSLICDSNLLTSLPVLPTSLSQLVCNQNPLVNGLPILPASLAILYCCDDQLSSLPALPSLLTDLRCQRNQLTSLPSLPAGLLYLICDSNQLTSLPTIPGTLYALYCSRNALTCLPLLPSSVINLRFDTTLITCIFNNVTNMFDANSHYFTSYTICTPVNTNGCTFTPPASYVLIPDTNFGKWLDTAGYASCMTGNSTTGWYMDTTCTAVMSATNMSCTFASIQDLNGIQYFHSLSSLDCMGNNLVNLPVLPASLIILTCVSNQITSLPNLPNALIFLKCGKNLLTSLPILPNTLFLLECDSNLLTSLPTLPPILDGLICASNLLVTMPSLPPLLYTLDCSHNHLASLPTLPSNLTILQCNENQLSSLPTLPTSLQRLFCQGNPLNCLPILPAAMNFLTIDTNLVQCISRFNAGMLLSHYGGHLFSTYPICTAGNINGCAVAPPANSVLIPDSNFGTWLNTNGYSTCMTGSNSAGWYMDTTCTAVTSATSIVCDFAGIQDLTGIQYFKAITTLYCYNNQMVSLPTLPSGLMFLSCQFNQLTSLPSLPGSLVSLVCFNNQLTSLPGLPASLTALMCENNSLSCLPLLPTSLNTLWFDSTVVHCLSRNVATMIVDDNSTHVLSTFPICAPGNTNGCAYVATSNNVLIPDSNFGTWLNTHGYAACMTGSNSAGWYMDTTCTAVTTAVNIHCTFASIKNLEGIQYFDSLVYLYCDSNQLTSLPNLPSLLTDLGCTRNLLTSLPSLPSSFRHLFCSFNQLTSLPSLPSSLTALYVDFNLLTSLPSLPSSLTSFFCTGNQITNLPILPSSLTDLLVDYNSLTSLPSLPSSLTFLSCGNNQLTSLPSLPNSLTAVYCNFNQLSSLPSLPSSLTTFSCTYNQLTSLPSLPSSLTTFFCSNNQLTSLSSLPQSLLSLECDNNQLTSLPSLPSTLNTLYCDNNVLFCLPLLPNQMLNLRFDTTFISCISNNAINMYDANGNYFTSYTICTPGNVNGCAIRLNLVLIPDSNFGTWLNTNGYGTCMTGSNSAGWYMDTTCNAVTSAKNINCSFASIKNLEGIQYFDSLTGLFANSNQLVSLPVALPDMLKEFNSNFNQLTSLPTLPSTLEKLQANNNQLSTLPALPSTLFNLDCSNNAITLLPALPPSLQQCRVGYNQLTSLPLLPGSSLYYLDCSHNILTTLPALPNSLTRVDCDHNQINNLPVLPSSLRTLQCNENQLTSLPSLPATLQSLTCQGNPINCLPILPTVMNFLTIDTHLVKCISKSTFGMSLGDSAGHAILSYPICNIGNANGCAYVPQDTVWPGDADNNKVVDNLDLLPIGLAYGVSGPVRTGASIVWAAQPATAWTDTIQGGQNDEYIDCNGDGIIDANDTVAILANWGNIHNKRSGNEPWRAGAPVLSIKYSKDTVYQGDTLTTSLILGDAATPVAAIYGLAFTLHYDALVMDSPTINFRFINSLFGTAGTHITIYKNDKKTGIIKAAVTGINKVNRSGYGNIAQLKAVITTGNINGKNLKYHTNLTYLSDITAIDIQRKPIALNTTSDSMQVGFTPTGIREISAIKLYLAPNPASQQVTIATASEMTDIHIYDVLGQEVLHTTPSRSQRETIDVSNLTAGVYMLQVFSSSGRGNARLVIR
jgi:Leucine-rich repeat (LRR) protein